MPRKKKKSSKCAGENRKKGETQPATSKELLNSDEIYEEVLIEIENCRENIKRAQSKLDVLKGFVDNEHVAEVVNDFEVMSRLAEKSVKSITDSRNEEISLERLPLIPMEHILLYLDKHDKRNLRLTSRTLKEIVDLKIHKICKIRYLPNHKNSFDPDILNFDCDIMCEYRPAYTKGDFVESPAKVASVLDQVSERVVQISGTAQLFKNLSDQATNYSNVKQITIHKSGLPPKILFPNLNILELYDIQMQKFDSGGFVLNQLEELHISHIKSRNGFQALLSTSRNIRHLRIVAVENDELKADFKLPNLKTLFLSTCSAEFLYIARGSASSLTDVSLHNLDLRILTTSKFKFPNPFGLSLSYGSRNGKDCTDFLFTNASCIKELKLTGLFSGNLQPPIPEFPKLEKLCLGDLEGESNSFSLIAIEIVKHAPNLKYFVQGNKLEGDICYPMTVSADQQTSPGAMYLSVRMFTPVVKEKFLQALSISSRQRIGELFLSWFYFDMPNLVNSEIATLTKLTLKDCKVYSGFENLLNKCCLTLEELRIQNSDFVINGAISELKSLKHISIGYRYGRGDMEDSQDRYVTELMKACDTSLERLTLAFPRAADLAYKLCHQVELPNLKILQISPRPKEKQLNVILEHFPDNLTFWPFEPKWLKLKHFYPELMNLVCPNDLYFHVSTRVLR